MAGIYIHIPYCKQACSYCDFYFSTSLKSKPLFLKSLEKEMELQRTFFSNEKIETIYFGGGTPSLLTEGEISQILEQVKNNFDVSNVSEITLEANPDNLSRRYLDALKKAGINRLSIGLQSFKDEELKELNRAHTARQNTEVVKQAQEAGFGNISVDLIYGTPFSDEHEWMLYVDRVINLGIQHVSCYQLTVEEKTRLHHKIKTGLIPAPDDELTEKQFLQLIQKMKEAGFKHYEVSNFGLPGFYSKHNSSYWKDIAYLGLGPSAHSYNRQSRFSNTANVYKYISAIEKNGSWFNEEKLNEKDQYNDFVLTGLRTEFGLDLTLLTNKLGQSYGNYFQRKAQGYIEKGDILKDAYVYRLREESFLFADRISADLFYI